MKARSTTPIAALTTKEIAEELDRLFRRQLQLMKSESFVGLTPHQREEYDALGSRIRELFIQLAKNS